MKPWQKNKNDKGAYVNIFSELMLTEKEEFPRYLWMKTTSYYWSYINFYSFITYTSYITYTLYISITQLKQ